jgi:hypothetical protein
MANMVLTDLKSSLSRRVTLTASFFDGLGSLRTGAEAGIEALEGNFTDPGVSCVE